MSKLLALGLTTLGLLAMVEIVRADGLLSKLNPFAAKTTTTSNPPSSGTSVITSNSGSKTITTVPTMLGKPVHPPPAQPSQPSMLSKIGSGISNGTANMFAKTKQLFTRSSPTPTAIPSNVPQYKTYPQPQTTSH